MKWSEIIKTYVQHILPESSLKSSAPNNFPREGNSLKVPQIIVMIMATHIQLCQSLYIIWTGAETGLMVFEEMIEQKCLQF